MTLSRFLDELAIINEERLAPDGPPMGAPEIRNLVTALRLGAKGARQLEEMLERRLHNAASRGDIPAQDAAKAKGKTKGKPPASDPVTEGSNVVRLPPRTRKVGGGTSGDAA